MRPREATVAQLQGAIQEEEQAGDGEATADVCHAVYLLVAVALAYSLAVNLLSMFESTMCLRFAGGDGCEEAPVATAAAPH